MTDKERVEKCAETLKKYCKAHKHRNSWVGCDCPFSQKFQAGYLCGLYGYPEDYDKEIKL